MNLKQLKKYIKESLKKIQLNEGLTILCCEEDPSGPGNPTPVYITVPNMMSCTDPFVVNSFGVFSDPIDGACGVSVDPTGDDPVEPWDPWVHTHDTGSGDPTGEDPMMSCDDCDGGYPISMMLPYDPAGCPPPMIATGTGDPCAGQLDPCTEAFAPGGCATTHQLTTRFVNNNPTNFINNMENGYTTRGCPFLQNRYNRHLGMINSNPQTFYGPNNPQGYVNPGPLWVNQKQSKVDFLACVIAACCTGGGTPPTTGGGTPQALVRPTRGGRRGRGDMTR
tara:strand:- start:191 stop:1027 length:837 start_codon:yes stop_codon:yes gene_type:complete